MNRIFSEGEGINGVCLRIVCWHGALLQVQESNHSNIVELGGLLLMVPAIANENNLWNLLVCSILTIWCIALLCPAIRSPLMCWFAHTEKRCGHVSIIARIQCTTVIVWVSGRNMFFKKNSHVLCVTKFKMFGWLMHQICQTISRRNWIVCD